jgi:hypothetical protein
MPEVVLYCPARGVSSLVIPSFLNVIRAKYDLEKIMIVNVERDIAMMLNFSVPTGPRSLVIIFENSNCF